GRWRAATARAWRRAPSCASAPRAGSTSGPVNPPCATTGRRCWRGEGSQSAAGEPAVSVLFRECTKITPRAHFIILRLGAGSCKTMPNVYACTSTRPLKHGPSFGRRKTEVDRHLNPVEGGCREQARRKVDGAGRFEGPR